MTKKELREMIKEQNESNSKLLNINQALNKRNLELHELNIELYEITRKMDLRIKELENNLLNNNIMEHVLLH